MKRRKNKQTRNKNTLQCRTGSLAGKRLKQQVAGCPAKNILTAEGQISFFSSSLTCTRCCGHLKQHPPPPQKKKKNQSVSPLKIVTTEDKPYCQFQGNLFRLGTSIGLYFSFTLTGKGPTQCFASMFKATTWIL